ncbi:MAG: hypothetical protein HC850_17210 [Rhodomicrobium sp.]|nr:hypothetical protein [Rhodomicrobium sp.]
MSATTMPCERAEAECVMPGREPARTYFFVTGENASEFLPRVLLPFAKLGLTPYRVHASAEHGAGEELSVELRFAGLAPGAAELLAGKCRSIVGVRSVMTVNGG